MTKNENNSKISLSPRIRGWRASKQRRRNCICPVLYPGNDRYNYFGRGEVMRTQHTHKPSLDVRKGINGNLSGALYVLGRMAQQAGKSIFDCPFEAGSDKAELWMDGYMFEDKKSKRYESR